MNAALPLPAILAALPADAAQAGDTIGVATALCLVLGACLALLVRAHVALRGRVEELERILSASAPPAPTPTAAASPAVEIATAPVPAPYAAPAASATPSAHLAVIAAAVHHAFRGRARLASVQAAPAMPPANHAAHAPVDWAREGRRDIFSSHRVR